MPSIPRHLTPHIAPSLLLLSLQSPLKGMVAMAWAPGSFLQGERFRQGFLEPHPLPDPSNNTAGQAPWAPPGLPAFEAPPFWAGPGVQRGAGRQAGERHSCTHAEEGEALKADLRPVMDTEGKEARPPTLFTLGCSVYPEKTHPRLWPYSKPARASEL